ncbi:DUF2125 domain-containing protein [Methylobrevis albus]|uniref:DUF2125 domain-containing protein n=1 Tax=Methylobrevis albus TaxID=2793297 RepID=A0A931MXJ1_9HYPH|nr:DUF2125 domain-containing protein [Methylobrevis albus]MBH0237202.1 DUF2125 domain-containing protein [Methylobrevis albus]
MRNKVIILGVAVIAVVALWSWGWTVVRDRAVTELDRAVADLAARGGSFACAERDTGGWPFRLDLDCRQPRLTLPDGTGITAARLLVTGVIDDWRLVVASVEGPLQVAAPDGSAVDASFARLQLSLRHDGRRPERLSAAADALSLDVVPPGGDTALPAVGLDAAYAEVHVRAGAAPDSLDAATLLRAATLDVAGRGSLPDAADLRASAVIGAVGPLAVGPAAWRDAGGSIDITSLDFTMAPTTISGGGRLGIDGDGRLEGQIDLTARGLDGLTSAAAAGRSIAAPVAALGTAFLILGSPAGDGARALSVSAVDGTLSANGMTLTRLAPVF